MSNDHPHQRRFPQSSDPWPPREQPASEADTNATPWGAIVGGLLVGLSFVLTLSQEGKPLIMYSEEAVLIGLVCALAGAGAVWFGPKQKVTTILVVVLAVVAVVAAVYDIAAYEQAVAELQRDMQGW